jgi:hypothetical protein
MRQQDAGDREDDEQYGPDGVLGAAPEFWEGGDTAQLTWDEWGWVGEAVRGDVEQDKLRSVHLVSYREKKLYMYRLFEKKNHDCGIAAFRSKRERTKISGFF